MRFKPKTRKIVEAGLWEASIVYDFARGKKTVYELGRTKQDAINSLKINLGKLLNAETAYKVVPKEERKKQSTGAEFKVIEETPRYNSLCTWEHNLISAVRWEDTEQAKDDVCFYVKQWMQKIAEGEDFKIILRDK